MNNLIVTVERLGDFLNCLKVFIKDYFDSRIDKKIDATSDNPVANSVVSKNIWVGKSTEIDAAIEAGDIIPGYTNVVVTDDDAQAYVWGTLADIYAMFGLEYKAA